MTKEEYFEQAVNAFGEDKLDESIQMYRKALELDPAYQDALHGLGMALFNRGHFDEAVATAKRLIEIDPAYVEITICRWQRLTGELARLSSSGRTLEEVAAGAAAALRPGGLLVFTVEEDVDADLAQSYRIRPHGRYTHGLAYVDRLLVSVGLTPRIGRADLRLDSISGQMPLACPSEVSKYSCTSKSRR